jgi:cation diffusion facilitator CzcD-associated flavoprotein CzcO
MTYHFTVIGAGPAGIAAIGKLLDSGMAADKIAWVDTHFQVGDFGTCWRNVPSNTKVKLFLKFLHGSPAFGYSQAPDFELNHLDPELTCTLKYMADVLQWVSAQLRQQVTVLQDFAHKIVQQKNDWDIHLKTTTIQSKNIILAVGAEPLGLVSSIPTLGLADAMDAERVKTQVDIKDTVAVYGSSHSAMLVLRNLVEYGVKHIINIYRSPLLYAIYHPDWIEYDDTGLKGTTADWARINIDGTLPRNLTRLHTSDEQIEALLANCNKVVYAIGFERRHLPEIENAVIQDYWVNQGMLAPGLFGLGIAFPEAKYNRVNKLEYRVGLWKFMEYLTEVLPVWLAAGQN